jgi:hypothetical protein
MTNLEITNKWLIGISGSVMAMVSPTLEKIELDIRICGGLLGMAVTIFSLYKLIKNNK